MSNSLSTPVKDAVAISGAWGSEGTSSKDLVIPKIQLVQASSNTCKEGTARPGDLIHSLTKEALAPKGKKLEILPILCVGSWTVTSPKPMHGGFPDFIRKEPLTTANDSDEWKVEKFEGDKAVVWHKSLTYLSLLTSRADGFPFFIDFAATNKSAGKLISTIIQENKFLGQPAPSRAVEISTRLKSFGGNSWFVMDVAPSRLASAEELAACKKWYDLFAKVQFKEAEPEESQVPF